MLWPCYHCHLWASCYPERGGEVVVLFALPEDPLPCSHPQGALHEGSQITISLLIPW